MLKDTGQQRSISLDSRKTTIALENEFWGIIQYCAEEEGYDNWQDWLHVNVLQHWDGKRNLASHVRSFVAISLVTEVEMFKQERDPEREALANMQRMVSYMPKGYNVQ